MREIKFRVWWSTPKEMDYPKRASHALDYAEDNPKIPIMQYTGLKDKNGIEIYEGDIVKWRSIHNKRSTDTHIDAVEFASGYWNLTPWVHELYSCHDDIEVIGNIYEHPHLLEGPE